ncbi:hypothetical protein HMPREF3156_02457 [Neisseria sp. HMSC06F02]|nr:hypothetical protein HMPREF3156_02457 [Neisseria sp. HMSC06F02]
MKTPDSDFYLRGNEGYWVFFILIDYRGSSENLICQEFQTTFG